MLIIIQCVVEIDDVKKSKPFLFLSDSFDYVGIVIYITIPTLHYIPQILCICPLKHLGGEGSA